MVKYEDGDLLGPSACGYWARRFVSGSQEAPERPREAPRGPQEASKQLPRDLQKNSRKLQDLVKTYDLYIFFVCFYCFVMNGVFWRFGELSSIQGGSVT